MRENKYFSILDFDHGSLNTRALDIPSIFSIVPCEREQAFFHIRFWSRCPRLYNWYDWLGIFSGPNTSHYFHTSLSNPSFSFSATRWTRPCLMRSWRCSIFIAWKKAEKNVFFIRFASNTRASFVLGDLLLVQAGHCRGHQHWQAWNAGFQGTMYSKQRLFSSKADDLKYQQHSLHYLGLDQSPHTLSNPDGSYVHSKPQISSLLYIS